MPQKPAAEFWKDLEPIAKAFQWDSLPEVYIHNAPTADEKTPGEAHTLVASRFSR